MQGVGVVKSHARLRGGCNIAYHIDRGSHKVMGTFGVLIWESPPPLENDCPLNSFVRLPGKKIITITKIINKSAIKSEGISRLMFERNVCNVSTIQYISHTHKCSIEYECNVIIKVLTTNLWRMFSSIASKLCTGQIYTCGQWV